MTPSGRSTQSAPNAVAATRIKSHGSKLIANVVVIARLLRLASPLLRGYGAMRYIGIGGTAQFGVCALPILDEAKPTCDDDGLATGASVELA
jgi:hypothetical protein